MNTEQREQCQVTRAIKRALVLIAKQNPELALLLEETIETGEYLRYSPASQPTPRRKSQRAKKKVLPTGKEPNKPGRR
jgi:hypothetical protein